MRIAEVIVFIVYLIILIGIGVHFFLKSKTGGEKTYFLGGRQMGPWVSALSAGASDMRACPPPSAPPASARHGSPSASPSATPSAGSSKPPGCAASPSWRTTPSPFPST